VIRDEILRDMRNGMTMAELRKKYRGQSQFYEAFRIFSGEMEKIVNEERSNIQDVRGKLSGAKAEFGGVDAARVKASGEVAGLRLEKDRLAAEVGIAEKRQDQLRGEVKVFEGRGFSPGVPVERGNLLVKLAGSQVFRPRGFRKELHEDS
jgi:hypothetical protein